MDWKDTAMEESDVLDLMIREMVKNEDRIPTQLVEPVGNILMILSDIESLKANNKANLKPLAHQASGLIIVLWKLYLKDRYPSLWPPPPLNRTVDKFAKTVDSIRKLLARKCEKTFLKKKIFAVLDMWKVKKYLCKLDAAATNIEAAVPRHGVDVNAVLLEAVEEYCRDNLQDEAQLPEVEEVEAGKSSRRQQEAEKSSLAEIAAGQKSEASEEDGDHEEETSTQASRETQTSQSSSSSPSSNNTGSIEEDRNHEAETSTRASRDSETMESQSSPPSLQNMTRMFNTFNNTGSGVMINRNIGNIRNTTISNVGNNNSVNHHYHR